MSSVMVQINTSVRGCHDVEWQSSFAAATRGEKNKKKKSKTQKPRCSYLSCPAQ